MNFCFLKAAVSCKTVKKSDSWFLSYFTRWQMNAEALLLWSVTNTVKVIPHVPLWLLAAVELRVARDKLFLDLSPLFCILYLSLEIWLRFNTFVSFNQAKSAVQKSWYFSKYFKNNLWKHIAENHYSWICLDTYKHNSLEVLLINDFYSSDVLVLTCPHFRVIQYDEKKYNKQKKPPKQNKKIVTL